MYRDSQHGLTIDLAGPDGNAFFLMGLADDWLKQMGHTPDDRRKFLNRMQESDYNRLLDVFDEQFPNMATFLNDPRDDDE
jgi:hypothetical protein